MIPSIGEVNQNFSLKTIIANPEYVEISGPKTVIEQIETIESEPLDLRNLKENKEFVLKLRSPDPAVNLSDQEILANPSLISVSEDFNFEKIEVEVRSNLAKNFLIEPRQVKVNVRGPKGEKIILEENPPVAFVKMNRKTEKLKKLEVQVDLPANFSLLLVEPEVVDIKEVKNEK